MADVAKDNPEILTDEVSTTVDKVSEAVAEAGQIKQPTAKQLEKQKKQEKAYWGGMITRQEALDLARGIAKQQDEKLRMLYISVNTLIAMVKAKGYATEDEINEFSKPFVELIYGKAPEEKEKEEATAEGTEAVVSGGEVDGQPSSETGGEASE